MTPVEVKPEQSKMDGPEDLKVNNKLQSEFLRRYEKSRQEAIQRRAKIEKETQMLREKAKEEEFERGQQLEFEVQLRSMTAVLEADQRREERQSREEERFQSKRYADEIIPVAHEPVLIDLGDHSSENATGEMVTW